MKFRFNFYFRQLEISTVYTAGGAFRSRETWQVKLPELKPLVWHNKNCQDKHSSMHFKESKMKSSSSPTLVLNGIKSFDELIINDHNNITAQKIKVEPNADVDVKLNDNPKIYLNRPKNYNTPRKIPTICVDDNHDKPPIEVNKDHNDEQKTVLKKQLRPLMAQADILVTPQTHNGYLKIIFFSLFAFASVIIGSLVNEFNQKPFDFTNTSLELNQKIFGQQNALNELAEHFHQNTNDFNAIIFVGGTGVGKSYTANIIRNNFPYIYNIFEYYRPLKENIEPSYNSLSSLHCNLVLLENLKSDDLPDLIELVDYFYKQKNRPCMIVLAIVNPQSTDEHLIKTLDLDKSVKEIQNKFNMLDVPVKTISFQPLTIETIRLCIKEEERRNNIQLSASEFDDVLTHLIVSNSGCKRAYAKVQLNIKT